MYFILSIVGLVLLSATITIKNQAHFLFFLFAITFALTFVLAITWFFNGGSDPRPETPSTQNRRYWK